MDAIAPKTFDQVPDRDRTIKLAILAVGGQGGGVITSWIVDLAERNGWYAQSTSVPGVAQRTGATVYYVEMVPEGESTPVLGMMPSPGDVDVVMAAELMEAGRAIQRGFVSPDRTTLIFSTDRTMAVAEKIVPGDGIADSVPVMEAAREVAKEVHAARLELLATQSGSVISSSLFGALAGSGALPFPRETFEQTIEASGRGVKASLKAFAAGFDAVRGTAGVQEATRASEAPDIAAPAPAGPAVAGPEKMRQAWDTLLQRIEREFPAEAQMMARAGLKKVVDFQDVRYGKEYLDRLAAMLRIDEAAGGAERDHDFTVAAAKYIANAMAYDDVIRVADLKTRGSRIERVGADVRVTSEQVLQITEFMHPRLEEMCGMLPASFGRRILANEGLSKRLDRFINKGRRVRTDTIRGFLTLYAIGSLRGYRRRTLRHEMEVAHLEKWLALASETVAEDYGLGVEVLRARRLIKGYSDTHVRGESKFDRVLSAVPLLKGRDDSATWLNRLIEASLKDEKGDMLDGALKTIRTL
ncbi:indolepyruvate oxidoreductase subunit beta family protein [Amorphus sp. 3PC139-8]|uniref:indolepyruvate oxidoreductase subunit beta family protein n=1 Tax=Amorphus sp. 3PC139-8 TaxID=2735676 RepID=UPI00345D6532